MKVSYKKLIPLILIFVILGLFLVKVGEANASIASIITDVLIGGLAGDIVKLVASLFLWVAGFLVTVCALLLQLVLEFGFMNLKGVEMGWTICRDVTNMFFILGLVVIAFATILRFETYGMKVLLPKLIIIALLINFSFLICGAIIDATQIIANYFVNKIKGEPAISIGIRLLDALQVGSSFNPSKTGVGTLEVINVTGNFIKFAVSTIFIALILMLTCLALIVGAILLLIRIGALWILMILAPFAWFFSIFPGLKALSKKWWDNFLKYAFFAPIYVFFIYLIVYISPHIFNQAQTMVQNNVDATFLENFKNFALTEFASGINLIFGFVFVIMLLLGAPVIATSMGLHATGAVVKTYQGIKGKAAALPWKGFRNLLQKFDRDVLSPRGLSPRDFIDAWKIRKIRIEQEKRMVGIAEMHDRLNLYGGEGKTFFGEQARDKLRQEKQKIIREQGLTPEGLGNIINEAKKAVERGELHRIHEFTGGIMQSVEQADEEGIMGNDELGKKYGYLTSLKNLQQLIRDVIKDKEEAIRFAGQIGALAKQRGIHYLDGMTQYDPDKKKMDWTLTKEEWDKLSKEKQEKLKYLGVKGAVELSKLSARYIYQYSNRRNFMMMDKDSNAAGPTELLRHFLERSIFDKAHLTQLGTYMAPETVTYFKKYLDEGKNMETFQKMIDDISERNPTAQAWFDTLKNKIAGVSP